MNEVEIPKAVVGVNTEYIAEEAILSLALEKCLTCLGERQLDYGETPTLDNPALPCADCEDDDAKPTGRRFPTLSCWGIHWEEDTPKKRAILGGSVFTTNRVAIDWRDERTIRLAAEVGGYRPYYISGIEDAPAQGWIVMLTGKTNAQYGWSTELVLAWDKAVKAELGGHM